MIKWMVLGLVLACGAFADVDGAARFPNVLLILSDDQGYGDFGFTGNKVVQTPTLDRLSKQSAFYPYFVVGPACTPTRSSLLTGRNHLDTGVWGVGSRGMVRRDETYMPKFFTPSGYQVWTFGKIDGGISMMEVTPADRGFDFCYTPPGATRSYQHKLPGGWGAEMVTDTVIQKIREAGDTPWMAHVNYIIPHLLWHCPDSYADLFRKKGYSEDLAQCYGSIKQMDDQIKRLLKALDESGQLENTVVLFFSDNGSVDAVDDRAMGVWENANRKRPHSSDWGIRNPLSLIGRKGEVWDNGIRSPLLVRWPGKIKPGIRKHVVGVEDVLPTLLELCRIPDDTHPEHLPFAGTSFAASLKDRTFTDERELFRLASGGPGTPRGGAGKPSGQGGHIPDSKTLGYETLHTVLRSGKYKFHHLPGGKFRLYNMEKDPCEQKDLSEKYPERTEAMAARCRAQWDGIAARNRTFPMRQLRINNAEHPRQAWNVPVLQPLHLEGNMNMHPWLGGVKGFRFPEDRAEYAVEVQKPLTVSIVAEGTGFDQCATISLLVNGRLVEVKSRSADRILFGSVDFPSGTTPLSLVVPADAKAGSGIGEVLKLTLKLEK